MSYLNEEKYLEIQNGLNEAVKEGIFPGACAAVLGRNEIDYFCVGKRALVPNVEDNKLETIYDLASLSKVVATTTMLLRLREMGLVDFKKTYHEYVPAFIHTHITIEDLLSHRSGLPSDTPLNLTDTKAEVIEKILHCPLKYATNTQVVYSDIGFMLLGLLIEKVMNESLDKCAEKLVFKPLNMHNTGYLLKCDINLFAPTEDSIHFHKIIRGSVHDRKANLMEGVSGHAGVFSCIEDMAKFAQMLVNRGMYNNEPFLSEESIQLLYTNLSPEGEIKRGIGYLIYDERSPFGKYCSSCSIMHTGFAGTSILVDFEKGEGVVLLSNRIHPSRNNPGILEYRKVFHELVFKR